MLLIPKEWASHVALTFSYLPSLRVQGLINGACDQTKGVGKPEGQPGGSPELCEKALNYHMESQAILLRAPNQPQNPELCCGTPSYTCRLSNYAADPQTTLRSPKLCRRAPSKAMEPWGPVSVTRRHQMVSTTLALPFQLLCSKLFGYS